MYTLVSTSRCARIALVTLALAPLSSALAQTPQRLPGMSVIAPPGPRIFMGVVNDTSGFALEGVEVSIPTLQRRTFTKADGTFRFDDIRAGGYLVRARKFGFQPQVRPFKIETDGARGTFDLIPLPYSLPAVTVASGRGGLSGIVADTGYNPVAAADVFLLGKSLVGETDSSGVFYIPAPPGHFMVTFEKVGFADRVMSVTIPEDSGRRVSVFLLPGHPVTAREANNLLDLEQRQSWRVRLQDPFYTREDIQKLGIEWIADLVRTAAMDQFDADCSVTVDGGPATAKLATLTVDDVEAVEIYGGSRFTKPQSVASIRLPPIFLPPARGSKVPVVPRAEKQVPLALSNTERAAHENRMSKCPTVYVWMR